MNRASLLAAVALLLASCASFNKQCFGDGVCRVEKDGQVGWEGPPEQVAKRKGAEDKQAQQAAALDRHGRKPRSVRRRAPSGSRSWAPPRRRPRSGAVAAYQAMIGGGDAGDSRISSCPRHR
jgi:hypothetical protein